MKCKYLWLTLLAVTLMASPARAMPNAEGEFRGTVVSVEYLDAQKEEKDRYNLARISVQDPYGKTLIFLVNRDTKIKSPQWGDAHLVYVQKGMRVEIEYFIDEKKNPVAHNIYVKKE